MILFRSKNSELCSKLLKHNKNRFDENFKEKDWLVILIILQIEYIIIQNCITIYCQLTNTNIQYI